MQLYSYFRSSAAYRVRIALALKGLDYEYLPIHLVKQEQSSAAYTQLAPNALVPLLIEGEGEGKAGERPIGQSLAIIEYLDEVHPYPPLLPSDPLGRARVRALALDVACDIHPINNLRVLRYLLHDVGVSEEVKVEWQRHWITVGFQAIERQLAGHPQTGKFCHGDTPGFADLSLIPQVFNAGRVDVDMTPYPTIARINAACMQLDAFAKAQPSACPDSQ
jgi:maleylacetoacetate isomerase